MNAVEYCLLNGLKVAGPDHPALLCASETLSYGALASLAATLPVPKDIAPKDPKAYRLVGTPAKRLDTRSKTNGSAQAAAVLAPRQRITAVPYAIRARTATALDGLRSVATTGTHDTEPLVTWWATAGARSPSS